MTAVQDTVKPMPWWREPTRDQWLSWWAAWLGWTLDAFDFTMFLLIMVPISQEFHVPLTASPSSSLTLVAAPHRRGGFGLARRSGRTQDPADDLDPVVFDLQLHRRLLAELRVPVFLPRAAWHRHGRGMAGRAALAMETWPARSRGLMGGVLQGSWGLGFMLSSAIYGLFYSYIGWRGMLWIGILPALAVVYVRKYVKEPPVWLENRRRQREEQREVRAPLLAIFKPGAARQHVDRLLLDGERLHYLLRDECLVRDASAEGPQPVTGAGRDADLLRQSRRRSWRPLHGAGWLTASAGAGLSSSRRCSRCPLAPMYLLSTNFLWVALGFIAQGVCAGGGMQGQMVPYLNERFPTEIRATATAFCYHQAAIFGGFVPLILTASAEYFGTGLAEPMIVATWIGCVAWSLAAYYGPETKDTVMVPDLAVA